MAGAALGGDATRLFAKKLDLYIPTYGRQHQRHQQQRRQYVPTSDVAAAEQRHHSTTTIARIATKPVHHSKEKTATYNSYIIQQLQ